MYGAEAESTGAVSVIDVESSVESDQMAPTVTAPAIPPTAPCAVPVVWSVSLPGVGGARGRAFIDEDCTRRELARMFSELDERPTALAILCSSAHAPQPCPVESLD